MTDTTAKKRLGQYFSGSKIANLLVSLCVPTDKDYVIDPMAGNGDMLVAAIKSGVPSKNVSGIEIDVVAGSWCKKRVDQGNVYIGDAFSSESFSTLGRMEWDMVITNPPYVRYQSMYGFEGDGIRLKSAKEIRQSLSDLVEKVTHLNNDEKTCFQQIIRYYSGLSDLAVPAWLLCAALTKVGGRLAMVVPESWISRDYALSIKYMLLKFFDIEYVVEDLNSVWFPDAQIKTNFLVAKRVGFRRNVNNIGESAYKHIRLGAGLIGENSLVEKLKVGGIMGNQAFKSLLIATGDTYGEGYEIKHIHLRDFLSEMAAYQGFEKLWRKLEPRTKSVTPVSIPKELQEAMGYGVHPANLTKIRHWGFNVGQGLRTGANRFFYTELHRNQGAIEYLVTDKSFGEKIVPVVKKYTLPVFRYQSDVKDGIVISKDMLVHRLLYIQEDFYDSNGQLQDSADAPLAEYIANAENTPIKINGRLKHIPELSAVKPNVRSTEVAGRLMRRHWFMLPMLGNRHIPQLCISRVNYKSARCCLVADKGIVVDANFSTLWMIKGDKQQKYAMFALLNSTWVQCYLEAIATVMGGGALKVEASHIRMIRLPQPTDELIESLSLLGRRLAEGKSSELSNIISKIDRTVIRSLLNRSDIEEESAALKRYLQSKISARQR